MPSDPHDDPIADAHRDWASRHEDDESTPVKHQPNSWNIQKITTTEPSLEPHCQALIPIPPPQIPWTLTWMDRRLLQALCIKAE